MSVYEQSVGNTRLSVTEEGALNHVYSYGVQLTVGYNSAALSVENLRELHFLIGRAIDSAERHRANFERQLARDQNPR